MTLFQLSMSLKSQVKLEIGHCLLLCQSLLLFLQILSPLHKIIAGSGSEETKEDLKKHLTAFDKYLKDNNSKYIGGELLLLLNVAGIYRDETQKVESSHPLAHSMSPALLCFLCREARPSPHPFYYFFCLQPLIDSWGRTLMKGALDACRLNILI